jgi:uncharacterized protein (TIGR02266 family)
MLPRQQAPRPTRLEVEVPLRVAGDDGSSVGRVKNLGPGGMFMASDRRHEVGERFALTFKLPDQAHAISVAAEVCWVQLAGDHGPGVGLRFIGLSREATIAIQEFRRRQDEDLTPSWPST